MGGAFHVEHFSDNHNERHLALKSFQAEGSVSRGTFFDNHHGKYLAFKSR